MVCCDDHKSTAVVSKDLKLDQYMKGILWCHFLEQQHIDITMQNSPPRTNPPSLLTTAPLVYYCYTHCFLLDWVPFQQPLAGFCLKLQIKTWLATCKIKSWPPIYQQDQHNWLFSALLHACMLLVPACCVQSPHDQRESQKGFWSPEHSSKLSVLKDVWLSQHLWYLPQQG